MRSWYAWRWKTAWLVVGSLLVLYGRANAGGFTIIELGAKKTGMMTSIAKPDDLTGVLHNPAGLADLAGTRLHLSCGLSFVDASVRLKSWEENLSKGYLASDTIMPEYAVDDEGTFVGTVKPTRYFGAMPMLAASSDFGIADGPVFALSLYVPDFIGAFLPEDSPTRYMVTEAYFIVGMLSLTAAYRFPEPMDWLALGASLGMLYTRIEGKRWYNVGIFSSMHSDYVLHLTGEDYRLFWNVGISITPLPGVVLGLAYLSGTDVALEGELAISLAPGEEEELAIIEAAGGLVGNYRQTTHMKMPQGLATGISWAILDELELAVDFRYWFYRVFEHQDMNHDIDLSFWGEQMVDSPLRTPKNYDDSWTISVGVLGRPFWSWLKLELMAGWTYDESPAPSQTKSLDMPTADLTGFALGGRYTFDEHWRVSLTYYHYWYLKDAIDDSILAPPQNMTFWGQVDTVSVQLDVTL